MTHASLFSGIGGFDLAARNCGIHNIFQVEIDEFCQKVLEKNFPETIKYRDIKQFDGTKYYGTIDIISGGFPCQPFSTAGRRKGTSDDRFLWGEMFRVISEIKPRWVVAENVQGLLSIENGMVFEQCCVDLENEGYEVQAFNIPAIAVNAPHRRKRVWIVAYNFANSDSFRYGGWKGKQCTNETNWIQQSEYKGDSLGDKTKGCDRKLTEYSSNTNVIRDIRHELQSNISCTTGQGWKGYEEDGELGWDRHWMEIATKFCRMDDGISDRIHRVKALGNAIVPQIAEKIFMTILKTQETDNAK